MEDNVNKDDICQQKNDPARSPEATQVPPSLLPGVLHRLGLTPEQTRQEMSIEEAIIKLKSNAWEERVLALRLLEKRAAAVPVELLEAALEDEDSAVRAAAVHAMGCVGKRAPLHRLVQTLHDSDWHVRETAVWALGEQGPRVPDEVFKTALYDRDPSVREAARYALQRHVSTGETSAVYGQLQEKKGMQQNNDVIEANSLGDRSPYGNLNVNDAYNGNAGRSHSLQEQAHVYTSQEQAPYEYGSGGPGGGKVTSFSVRNSSKKWWIIIPVVALFFFIMGATIVPLLAISRTSSVTVAAQPQRAGDSILVLFRLTKYQNMLEQEVSSGLNLTQEQVQAQVQMGKSMTDIATAQGISTDQLRMIERKAFSDTLQAMVKVGDVSQAEADTWQARNLSNPEQVDMWTRRIFTPPPAPPGN
jgi:HEAT repeats